MSLLFEWDHKKAIRNFKKHGVSFEEATSVFGDALSSTVHDPLHSESEHRFVIVGQSIKNRVLVVVHTERDHRIRIISARLSTKREIKIYEEKK